MNEELLKRIDVLAEKLGTTASHVYQVYVAQARVDAVQNLVGMLFFGAVLVFSLMWARKIWRDRIDGGGLGPFVGLLGVAGVCLIIVLVSLNSIIEDSFNPEYFAIHHIAEDLKK